MPDSTTTRASVVPCGPAAVRVTGTTGDREQDWGLVHHLAQRLQGEPPVGYNGSIPTYESVLVEFDACVGNVESVIAKITMLLSDIDPAQPLTSHPQHFTVPVRYGDEAGPDLGSVAEMTGLDVAEVIRLHAEPLYTIRCLGSPGGSPMLDGPAFPVPIPRLSSPRTTVPAGVVSVAGRQATIAPASAPGGWQVIGRTPLVIMDLTTEPLVPYRPGDTLSFQPIDAAEYDRLAARPRQLRATA